ESWINLLQARNNLNRIGIVTIMKQQNFDSEYSVDEIWAEAKVNIARAERRFEQFDKLPKLPVHDPERLQILKQTYRDYLNALKELDILLTKKDFKS
ncbi:Tar ligand binding domain-containing protein, partial [Xenorhabdus bovienii]